MTTEIIKEKNNATLSGKVKPSQKVYIDEAMTGEFNEKLAELIEAHKEMKRKKQANKVQITNKLEKINQYNDSINEIIKSIALDSEQLVELNIENVNTKIDELKSLDEENKNLQKQHDEICKEKDQLLEENNELKEQVVTLEGNTCLLYTSDAADD